MIPVNYRSARLLLLCLMAAVGCGGGEEDRLTVHPTSGKVTIQGKTAGGVLVVLHPAGGSPAAKEGVMPSATTEEDGTFHLSSYEQADGAPLGDYTVTVQWYLSDVRTANRKPAMPTGFAPPSDRFRGKYNDPKKSPWQVTITEGNNVLKPIEVK